MFGRGFEKGIVLECLFGRGFEKGIVLPKMSTLFFRVLCKMCRAYPVVCFIPQFSVNIDF